MEVLSIVSLIACIIYFHIGLYIYKVNKKSSLHKIVFILCITLAIWSFIYTFAYVTVSNEKNILGKSTEIIGSYFLAIILHSIMIFTKNKNVNNTIVKILIYTPSSIFLLMELFSYKAYIIDTIFYFGNIIYGFSYFFISFVLIYRWRLKANTLREKKQGTIIMISGTLTYLPIQIIEIFSKTNNLINIEQFFNFILIFGIYYASVKYELFEISSKLIIDEVLSEMMDIVIVISPKGEILRVNRHMECLTGYNSIELIGNPFSLLVKDKYLINSIINKDYNLGEQVKLQLNFTTKFGKVIPISISYSKIIDDKLKTLCGIVIVGHDIRETKNLEKEVLEHKKSEERLKESEKRFRLMFYKNSAVMYLIDPKTLNIFDANESAIKFYGYTEKEIKEKKITDINGLNYDEMKTAIMQMFIRNRDCYYFKHKLANGDIRDVEVYPTLIPVKNKQVIFSIVNDITERKKIEENISFLAYHDNLTGLPNRKLFIEKLNEEIKMSQISKKQFAVLYIDLDGFKLINDTFGHSTGDFLLCEVGKRIKKCIRRSDMLARMGGDEFTLLISDIKSYEEAELIAKKISKELKDPIVKDGQNLFAEASIGISIYPKHGQDIESLVEIADSNMYREKYNKKPSA